MSARNIFGVLFPFFREFLSFHLWHMCQNLPNFGKKFFFRGNADIGEGILLSAIGPPSILATASVSAVVFSAAGDSRKHRFIASCPVSTTSSYPESIAREEDTGHSRPQCQARTFSAKINKKSLF